MRQWLGIVSCPWLTGLLFATAACNAQTVVGAAGNDASTGPTGDSPP